MIEQEFIPYEQALALKELGFDEEQCLGWYESFYSSGTPHLQTEWLEEYLDFDILVPAPLYQQAFRFFREKYPRLDFGIGKVYNGTNYYHFHINLNWEYFEGTYEEVELELLKKLIELINMIYNDKIKLIEKWHNKIIPTSS
jgi:hypothetical protein